MWLLVFQPCHWLPQFCHATVGPHPVYLALLQEHLKWFFPKKTTVLMDKKKISDLVRLLQKHHGRIDPVQALKVRFCVIVWPKTCKHHVFCVLSNFLSYVSQELPTSISIAQLQGYLDASLRDVNHRLRNASVIEQVCKYEKAKTNKKLLDVYGRKVIIDESTICPECQRRVCNDRNKYFACFPVCSPFSSTLHRLNNCFTTVCTCFFRTMSWSTTVV